MKTHISKDMGLTMVLLSAIFLCNPIVAFTDILPDAIGFLLLLGGMYRLADMNEHLASALTRFRVLFGASVGLLAAGYMVRNYMQGREGEMNPYETPVTLLLFAFIQLVLYWVVVIPAFKHFFLGVDRLAERFEHTEKRPKKRTAGERMARMTTVFFIANTLLALLPELSILTTFEYEAGNQVILFGLVKKLQFSFDWYNFVGMFRILACLISLIFSVIWLICFLAYCIDLKRDKPWIQRMREHYESQVLTQTSMLAIRKFNFSFILLYIAVLFTLNVKMDYLSALPGVGFAFLTFAALFLLGDLLSRQKECYIACLGLGIISIVQMVTNRLFLERYLPTDALFSETALWWYVLLCALEVLEAIATVILVYYLLRALNEIVTRYTGVKYRTASESGELLAATATQKLHLHFSRRMKWVLALFFLACAGNVAMTVFSLYFPGIWIIPFGLTVAAIFLYFSLQGEIHEEVKNHFTEE